MTTQLFEIAEEQIRDAKVQAYLEETGRIIREGGLVAFPTETVYGLGGDAFNPDSSRKIYAAKGRPSDNPLIVHIADWEAIYRLSDAVDATVTKVAEAFWPGPLTIVLPKKAEVPDETTGGLNTVAVRMPSNVIAREFIRKSGGYVAAPSANLSGKPSPTKAKYVIQDMDGRIDAIIDGGENEIGLESTILDMTVNPPMILRPGFVTAKQVSQLLGCEVYLDPAVVHPQEGVRPKAPGMKYRHYAPQGDLVIVEGGAEEVSKAICRQIEIDHRNGERVAVIASGALQMVGETVEPGHHVFADADYVLEISASGDEKTVAKHLYSSLRECDDLGASKIYIQSFSKDGFGEAIMNRLLKAAGYCVVRAAELLADS